VDTPALTSHGGGDDCGGVMEVLACVVEVLLDVVEVPNCMALDVASASFFHVLAAKAIAGC
jgi:hypothetical protein